MLASMQTFMNGLTSWLPAKLEHPAEIALAKHVLRLGEVIELVARELKPHHLAGYLYELAIRPSVWKAGGILINMLIVLYLAFALRRRLAAPTRS